MMVTWGGRCGVSRQFRAVAEERCYTETGVDEWHKMRVGNRASLSADVCMGWESHGDNGTRKAAINRRQQRNRTRHRIDIPLDV